MISRYQSDMRAGGGVMMSSAQKVTRLRLAIKSGIVKIESVLTMTGVERLDTLAGQIYGNSRYWWVLAAASDIGWGLQLPPGTLIFIPNLQDALSV